MQYSLKHINSLILSRINNAVYFQREYLSVKRHDRKKIPSKEDKEANVVNFEFKKFAKIGRSMAENFEFGDISDIENPLENEIDKSEWSELDKTQKINEFPRKIFGSTLKRSNLFLVSKNRTEVRNDPPSELDYEFKIMSDVIKKLPPTNPFIQMMDNQYEPTYPISNESFHTKEKDVGFENHVLLDDLYEGFPKSGPIRNFMELVITGLSQNPYLTAKQKREQVDWFKNEFDKMTPEEIEDLINASQ